MILLLALLQAATPTVGDTIWVEREVRPPASAVVRAASWEPEGAIALLGPARITASEGVMTVHYPVVAWEPGRHRIEVPGPILLFSTGIEDTLPSRSVTLTVASVLPGGGNPDTLEIQPPAEVVGQEYTTWKPLLFTTLFAIALLLPLHWAWRRRGLPMVTEPAPDPDPLDSDMVREWADAGEERAVAHAGYLDLRRSLAARLPDAGGSLSHSDLMAVIARERPEWPAEDIRKVLQGLDTLRFRQKEGSGAFDRYREARDLARQLGGAPG